MTHFVDGPAAAAVLVLRRAPLYLRVTHCGAVWDALDQLEDCPQPAEEIFAYRRERPATTIHVDYARPRRSAWYRAATYRFVADQPPDEIMRDTARWREWCIERQARELRPAPG